MGFGVITRMVNKQATGNSGQTRSTDAAALIMVKHIDLKIYGSNKVILFRKCCTVDSAYPHGGEGSLGHGDRVKCVLYISVTLAYGKGEAALSI